MLFILLACCGVALSGCMEALQGGAPAPQRPSALLRMPTPVVGTTATHSSPAAPGSLAPDPATTGPSPAPTEVVVGPQPGALPPLVVPSGLERSNEARWREQQRDRVVFAGPQSFVTDGSDLYWYDPRNQQHVVLGRINGEFLAQARFVLKTRDVPALEVPYHVNSSYGLTALSPAIIERIQAAGYADWIETYVLESSDVQPR